jgi:hypothetical protein
MLLEWLHSVGEGHALKRERLYNHHLLEIGKFVYEFLLKFYPPIPPVLTRSEENCYIKDRQTHVQVLRSYLRTGHDLGPHTDYGQIVDGFKGYLYVNKIEVDPERFNQLNNLLEYMNIQIDHEIDPKKTAF